MLPFAINPGLEDFPVYQPGRPIEEVARELGLPAGDIIKLASNENPLGPSPAALAAMRNALETVNLYPDGNAFYLKQRLSRKLNIDPNHLILGNGSNEIIEFAGHALLSSDSSKSAQTEAEVVVSEYCFAVYPLVARLFNATLITVPALNYGHNLEAMLEAITHERASSLSQIRIIPPELLFPLLHCPGLLSKSLKMSCWCWMRLTSNFFPMLLISCLF